MESVLLYAIYRVYTEKLETLVRKVKDLFCVTSQRGRLDDSC